MFHFVRFAQDHKIHYISEGHHHCHQGWLQLHCPQCSGGRSGYHLGFSLERGNMNCWRCGPIPVVTFIMLVSRLSKERAKQIRWEYEGKDGKRIRRARTRRPRVSSVPPGLGPLGPRHRKYLLHERGLRSIDDLIDTWGLQATGPFSGLWNWRVVSPICDIDGSELAYIGRSINPDAHPKYKVTDDSLCVTDPKSFLYGIHKVPNDSVIIVEGPGDVWKVGPGAVATLGISFHQAQVNRLRQFKRRFVMYDPDDKAQKAAEKLANALAVFPGETEIIDGLSSDPGDMTYSQVKKLRRELGMETS